MNDTAFSMTDDMRSRVATMHQRADDGSITPVEFELPPDPEVHMGGHGLYSTVPDYLKFIRMWLNDGASEGGQVLAPETVAMAVGNHLQGLDEDQVAARRDPDALQRGGVLPRDAEVVGADLHDQRRGGADRTPGR